MASLQVKESHGHKYWYIVESRRVNGKPRPVVLAYLGKPEELLRRLQGLTQGYRFKSYSHGAVAALLAIASALEIPALINQYVKSPRPYMAKKPIRNQLTVGITLLLGALGRVCMPTSKRGWWNWAKTTSCEYLLRCKLDRVDSQHFWDLMDALPIAAIAKIERELLQRVRHLFPLPTDTLFYDTTNFFTYIATTNKRCTIAQRGKNKQKRYDLRQVGLALVVTREDFIPLFHLTYEGNCHDGVVFQRVSQTIHQRMVDVGLDLDRHTIVFDRGNNSKKNLQTIKTLNLHYVGALTPYHHKALVREAMNRLESVVIDDLPLAVFRDQREIWGEMRTVIVYLSDQLKAGQLRGLHHLLDKKKAALRKIKDSLDESAAHQRDRGQLETRISQLVKGQFLKHVIEWAVTENTEGRLGLEFSINRDQLKKVEDHLGVRILMTDRHEWSTTEIIQAFHGQANIELAFKNLKNPYHLTLKPQFHWTDQKIHVHYFMCVLGYLLATLVWQRARQTGQFNGTLDTLLDCLNNIRLTTLIENTAKQGRPKITYQLEDTSDQEDILIDALHIRSTHLQRPPFKEISVYKQ
jgi:transposase